MKFYRFTAYVRKRTAGVAVLFEPCTVLHERKLVDDATKSP